MTCLVPSLFIACSSSPGSTPGAASTGAGTGGGPVSGAGGASSSSGATTAAGTGGGSSATGGSIDVVTDDSSDEDSTVDDALPAAITAPVQLVGDGVPVAITRDDRIVYRSPEGLFSVKAAPGAPPRKAALVPGNVHVRGSTIFNFADVDWGTSEGILTFWTPRVGRRSVGPAMIGDNRIAARDDAAFVLFARNLQPDTMDIVVSSADAKEAYVLVPAAPRGSLDTCAPTFGFAGASAIVAWCAPGGASATLARFTRDAQGQWQQEILSQEAQGAWSSDATGEHLFYVTVGGQARVRDANGEKLVGKGVGWGMMHPQGTAAFFSVGDQLRRSDLVSAAVPIVVDGFQQVAAWSDDLGQLLYSSAIAYDQGKQQDLRATTTAWFNPTPAILVDQPVAILGRSALTADGRYALFLRDVSDQGGTLHVRTVTGDAEATFPNVDTVLAASGGVVLVTDNRSGPGTYPVLVDLKVLDAAGVDPPHLLEAGIDDGRNIQVTADRARVAYRRPGAPDVGGIWIRNIE